MKLFTFSFFSSGGHIVYPGGTVLAILKRELAFKDIFIFKMAAILFIGVKLPHQHSCKN